MNKRLQIIINRQVSSIQITIHIHKQKDLFWAIVLHNKPLFTQGNNCSGLLRDCFPEIRPLNVYSTKRLYTKQGPNCFGSHWGKAGLTGLHDPFSSNKETDHR